MGKRCPALLAAAKYHFGSYAAALNAAGIDPGSVLARPRWTKQQIIRVIKHARRRGLDLHWSAVVRRSGELRRAAFAAIRPSMFGTWGRAMQAAGLDEDSVRCYRSWSRILVLTELRSRRHEGLDLASATLHADDAGLHAAAVRLFGSYSKALLAARVSPAEVRKRRVWSRRRVIDALRQRKRRGKPLADGLLRRDDPALYGACLRHFGRYTHARAAMDAQTTSR